MEKMPMGLALEELEAQYVGLLPDRVEMRRRYRHLKRLRRGGNVNCSMEAIADTVGSVVTNPAETCFA